VKLTTEEVKFFIENHFSGFTLISQDASPSEISESQTGFAESGK
jgi:hypothetical protein